MTVLETERLRLRLMEPDDAEFILALLNESSFLQYIGDKCVRSHEDARHYIMNGPVKSYEQHGYGLYLTELKDDGTPIGICGLIKRDTLDHADIGFALRPQFWSRGYAFESASAVMAYGKRELGLDRIVAVSSPGNEASVRVLAKLGMKFKRMVQLSEDNEVELFV